MMGANGVTQCGAQSLRSHGSHRHCASEGVPRVLVVLAASVLTILSIQPLEARIDDDCAASAARYGKPVQDSLKESGLLYYRKDGLCLIAHFFSGRCDVMSIFSEKQFEGVPESLPEEKLTLLLNREGGAGWRRVPRLSMNDVWGSIDGRLFAIYDTMRHKLVIMTRSSYTREKEALAKEKADAASAF